MGGMKLRHSILSVLLGNFFLVGSASAASFESDIENGFFKANAIRTEHFQFEFSNVVANQADADDDGIADIIEITAQAAEDSWDQLIIEMDYAEPVEDGQVTFVIFDDTGEYLTPGALGITSLLSNGEPYIALDPWMSDAYLQVTMGHEFYHAIQFAYDYNFAYTYQGINFAEATATWVEDILFDSVDDYALYIAEFLSYVDYSIFASIVPSGTLYEYGMNIWPRFLSEYYDNELILEIWESYFNSSVSYNSDLKVYEAVDAVLDDRGASLSEVFQEFTLWNLNLEQYEEGELYPEVLILEGELSNEYVLSDENYAPALYGSNYLYFENTDGRSDFLFHLLKPEGVSFVVSLVPFDGSDYDTDRAQSAIVGLYEEMEEPLILEGITAQDGVVAVISALEIEFDDGNNWEVFDQGYLYAYLADYGLSEEEFNELIDEEVNEEIVQEEEGVKEGENLEEASDERDERSLTLSLLSYDQDSVTFSWNRLDDDSIDSYDLTYGTSSGSRAKKVEIENAYTTFYTLSKLEAGSTYYFTLTAEDEDGDTVGESSNEIAVTPAEWLFSDVSYMDIHYDAIEALVEIDIFEGYSDGSFHPEDEINRAELLKIFIEGRDIEVDAGVYKNCFPDVKQEWFAKYVCYAESQGWVKGYADGFFRPADPVNKVEALKMLFKVYELALTEGPVAQLKYTDLDENAWYAIYVWKASALGILEEATEAAFYPDSDRTRSEMALELYRYLVGAGELKE